MLYEFIITDCLVCGWPVTYTFMRDGTIIGIFKLFKLFKDVVGCKINVSMFVLDQMGLQMFASKQTYIQCNVVLFYFYV